MANANLALGALQKPAKGSVWKAARERRKAVRTYEEDEKAKVRTRDRVCRWPFCANCRGPARPRLEVAHLSAKGMGGDHGHKSSAKEMVLLDMLTHQSGPSSLEQHGRRIEVLDPDLGTYGPLEFWQLDDAGQWFMVARERAPFVLERD